MLREMHVCAPLHSFCVTHEWSSTRFVCKRLILCLHCVYQSLDGIKGDNAVAFTPTSQRRSTNYRRVYYEKNVLLLESVVASLKSSTNTRLEVNNLFKWIFVPLQLSKLKAVSHKVTCSGFYSFVSLSTTYRSSWFLLNCSSLQTIWSSFSQEKPNDNIKKTRTAFSTEWRPSIWIWQLKSALHKKIPPLRRAGVRHKPNA